MTLLELAESGDLEELKRRLHAKAIALSSYRGTMSETDKLIDEAYTFARLGDLEQATHLLRLLSHPKWRRVEDCEVQYEAAMAETRAREVA